MKQSARIIGLVAALGFLYAFFLSIGSFSQTAKRGEENYMRGRALANQYDCVGANREFDRAINANPNDPRYYVGRANCRIHVLADVNNTPEAAVQSATVLNAVIDGDLSAAIKADPKYAVAYFERAKARQRLIQSTNGDPVSAISDYDKALALEPENLEFLLERSHFFLIDLKDEKRGLEDMAVLIKRQPKEPGHYFVRGRFFSETERYPEAIKDISTAMRLGANEYWVRAFRADAYFKTKNYPAALADLNRILAKGTGLDVPFLEMRAKVYRAMGKKTLAQADERRAKRLQEKEKRDLEKFMNDRE